MRRALAIASGEQEKLDRLFKGDLRDLDQSPGAQILLDQKPAGQGDPLSCDGCVDRQCRLAKAHTPIIRHVMPEDAVELRPEIMRVVQLRQIDEVILCKLRRCNGYRFAAKERPGLQCCAKWRRALTHGKIDAICCKARHVLSGQNAQIDIGVLRGKVRQVRYQPF